VDGNRGGLVETKIDKKQRMVTLNVI
jgi:hypothetical protein